MEFGRYAASGVPACYHTHPQNYLVAPATAKSTGTAILTAGEDGQVKIWSAGGMLRSTVITSSFPVYSASWGPDSNAIVCGSAKDLHITPLQSGSKKMAWQAHDRAILKVDWSSVNDMIISGGEDCRYKVSSCSIGRAHHAKRLLPIFSSL